jgi:hypothetical protein
MHRHKTCQAAFAQAVLMLIIGFREEIVYTASVSLRFIEEFQHNTTIKVAVIWLHKSSI